VSAIRGDVRPYQGTSQSSFLRDPGAIGVRIPGRIRLFGGLGAIGVDSETDGPRYGIGEADFERANLEECQAHHDIHQEVDERNGWREPGEAAAIRRDEVFAAAGRVLSQVFVWCLLDAKGQTRPLSEALRRFIAIVAVMRPDLVGDRTYKQLASQLHCTRAALSALALRFTDSLGIHCRRQRRQQSREVFRRAQKGDRHWRHRRKAEGAKK